MYTGINTLARCMVTSSTMVISLKTDSTPQCFSSNPYIYQPKTLTEYMMSTACNGMNGMITHTRIPLASSLVPSVDVPIGDSSIMPVRPVHRGFLGLGFLKFKSTREHGIDPEIDKEVEHVKMMVELFFADHVLLVTALAFAIVSSYVNLYAVFMRYSRLDPYLRRLAQWSTLSLTRGQLDHYLDLH